MSDPYPYDCGYNGPGITFHLRFRRRFIPHSWLLYAEMDEKGTELQLHYTHTLVTIRGTNLGWLQEHIAKFQTSWVREMPATAKEDHPTIKWIEIAEKVSD